MEQIPDDFQLTKYFYDLPLEAIAQRPQIPRDRSRLLVYVQKEDQIIHDYFSSLPQYLPPNSLLVANNSQVVPCRFLGSKLSGGKAEIFLLEIDSGRAIRRCLVKAGGRRKKGERFIFHRDLFAQLVTVGSSGEAEVEFNRFSHFPPDGVITEIADLQAHGIVPIPPYIRKGQSDDQDQVDYQTIFAQQVGSLATPTAGLHFTPHLLQDLAHAQMTISPVTLHVGQGTFASVQVPDIRQHQMHTEYFAIPHHSWEQIGKANFLTAIGTTSLRVLAAAQQRLQAQMEMLPGHWYPTDLFLYPGANLARPPLFNALITNFHLPQSTLLMLVSAIIGREKTLAIYHEALNQKYRFFSYGDAMLILRSTF